MEYKYTIINHRDGIILESKEYPSVTKAVRAFNENIRRLDTDHAYVEIRDNEDETAGVIHIIGENIGIFVERANYGK